MVLRAAILGAVVSLVPILSSARGVAGGEDGTGGAGGVPEAPQPPEQPPQPEGEAPEEPAKEPAKTAPARPLDPDEQVVRDGLEKHLCPTKIEFLDDGRVRLIFNFGEKKDEHMPIFVPAVSDKPTSTFRWALDSEYVLGSWGRSTDTEVGSFHCEGIRLSNKGFAQLNVWFQDDLEAEISYAQSVSSSPRQTIAVVYTNASGSSLGSNYGSQCCLFSSGLLKKATGSYESIRNETETRIKLVVKEGSFHAYRDSKKRDTAKYPVKTYASGRVGILWGGGLASFVHRLEIVGKIDAKRMAAELKKRAGARRK